MTNKLTTRPYDSTTYLRTELECALYLQAAIDESDGDPAETEALEFIGQAAAWTDDTTMLKVNRSLAVFAGIA